MKWLQKQVNKSENFDQAIAVGIAIGIVLGIAINIYQTSSVVMVERVYAEEAEVVVPVEVMVKVTYTTERVEEIFKEAARKYGVSEEKILTTMRCESRGGISDIQSEHLYSFSNPAKGIYIGEREMSHGASQIHLPDHPHVTLEQANDPYFAAEFMAKAFAEGHAYWWTCYRINYM